MGALEGVRKLGNALADVVGLAVVAEEGGDGGGGIVGGGCGGQHGRSRRLSRDGGMDGNCVRIEFVC